MQNRQDQEVIRAIKEGQIDKYAILVQKYTKIVYSFVNRKLYDKNELDDLIQNTFVKFYKALNSFDLSRPVLPYLLEIAKNELRMYIRSHKNTVQLNERILEDDDIDVWNDTKDIENLLQSLSLEQREALNMLAEGYSYEEVATHLHRPVNTVKTIIRRARLKLKKVSNEKTRR